VNPGADICVQVTMPGMRPLHRCVARGFRKEVFHVVPPYPTTGLDAVELHLKSHDVRRIGTDDPQGLADALKA
jgi:hypothetical protein